MKYTCNFAFGMEDEEEEPVMPAAVPDKSSGSAGGSSGAFRTSRAAYADINRQLGSFYEDTAGETGEEREMQARIEELETQGAGQQQSGSFLDTMRDAVFGQGQPPRGSVPPTPTWWPCASFCPARPAAKWAWRWG